MPDHAPPTPTVNNSLWLARAARFALSILVLWFGLAAVYHVSPAERFHLVVPLLWALDFVLFRRKQVRLRWTFIVGIVLGAFIGLWYVLWLRAGSMGGRVDVREPLWWLLFLTGVLVLYHWLCVVLTQPLNLIAVTRRHLSTPGGWWLRLLRAALALVLFAPYLYTACNIHRFKIANATTPQQSYGLAYETVMFPATDGVPLSGWFIPAQHSTTTVLICHGISANKGNFLGFVPFLHRAGFNVFIFDLRGHGDSPGHTVSFGYYEAHDVRGAVKYLSRRPDTKNILAYGFSMGASSLLHAMPHLPTVRAVVVDSTFADMTLLGEQQMAFLPISIRNLMMSAIKCWTRVELGVPLAYISPRRHIGVISPRPLLIIHGAADTLIPPSQAQLNFQAAGQPRALWLVPGANHIQPMLVQEEAYQQRGLAFFRKALKKKSLYLNGNR